MDKRDGEVCIALISSLVILSLFYIALTLCHEPLGNGFKVCLVNAVQRDLQVPQQNQNLAECLFPSQAAWWDGCTLTWKSSVFVSMAKLCIGDTQPQVVVHVVSLSCDSV